MCVLCVLENKREEKNVVERFVLDDCFQTRFQRSTLNTYMDSTRIIVIVWSQYDGGNIEQRTIGCNCR